MMTEEQLKQNYSAIVDAASVRSNHAQSVDSAYRYIKPLTSAVEGVLSALENPEGRFMSGLSQIDYLTRGFGPKELVLVTGFSHAGKTQLINTMVLHNRGKRVLFFSMDDPSEMILLKLACMKEKISAQELELRLRRHDEGARLIIQQAASHAFENCIVIDDSLGLAAMAAACLEAEDFWGAPPDVVIIDYLASIAGNGSTDEEDGGVKQKVAALKRWVKDKPFPTVVVHQQTRSRGGPGAPPTIVSGAYGGEQEATILIGVRRKRDDDGLDQFDRDKHANTITLHVIKNKRPPSKITPHDGIDFYIDPDTGLISPWHDTIEGHAAGVREDHPT